MNIEKTNKFTKGQLPAPMYLSGNVMALLAGGKMYLPVCMRRILCSQYGVEVSKKNTDIVTQTLDLMLQTDLIEFTKGEGSPIVLSDFGKILWGSNKEEYLKENKRIMDRYLRETKEEMMKNDPIAFAVKFGKTPDDKDDAKKTAPVYHIESESEMDDVLRFLKELARNEIISSNDKDYGKVLEKNPASDDDFTKKLSELDDETFKKGTDRLLDDINKIPDEDVKKSVKMTAEDKENLLEIIKSCSEIQYVATTAVKDLDNGRDGLIYKTGAMQESLKNIVARVHNILDNIEKTDL